MKRRVEAKGRRYGGKPKIAFGRSLSARLASVGSAETRRIVLDPKGLIFSFLKSWADAFPHDAVLLPHSLLSSRGQADSPLGDAADKAANLMGCKSPAVNCPIQTASISDVERGNELYGARK
jgi:hypothetical protein